MALQERWTKEGTKGTTLSGTLDFWMTLVLDGMETDPPHGTN